MSQLETPCYAVGHGKFSSFRGGSSSELKNNPACLIVSVASKEMHIKMKRVVYKEDDPLTATVAKTDDSESRVKNSTETIFIA
ncbi:hypothetical protein Peur_004879 [Populus x canadensis]